MNMFNHTEIRRRVEGLDGANTTAIPSSAQNGHCSLEETTQKNRVSRFFSGDERWKGSIYQTSSDRFHNAITRRKQYVFELVDLLPGHPAGLALDVGCGSGEYLLELQKRGYTAFGIDLSPDMVNSCRNRLNGSGATVQCGDIESLPFPSATFDLVLCIGVLGYLLTDEEALRQVWRILRPGGHLIVNIENMMSNSNLDYIARKRFLGALRSFLGRPAGDSTRGVSMVSPWVLEHSPTHYRYRLYNPWKFEAMMADSGFRRVRSLTFGYQFRMLRRIRLIPESTLQNLEVLFEQLFRVTRLPYFRYSGEAYTGVFQKT